MKFYVTILDGRRTSFALGPFETHAEALGRVEAVTKFVMDRYQPQASFYAYGTSSLKEGPYPEGVLNGLID